MSTVAQRKEELASIREEKTAHQAIIKHYRYCEDFGERRIGDLDREIAALEAKKAQMIADIGDADERIISSTDSIGTLEKREAAVKNGATPRRVAHDEALKLVKRMRASLPDDKFMEWLNGMVN